MESKFQYNVVSDTFRDRDNILDDPMVDDLIKGKTVEVRNWSKGSTLYRAVNRKGWKLRTRSVNSEITILWLERIPTTNPLVSIENEKAPVFPNDTE